MDKIKNLDPFDECDLIGELKEQHDCIDELVTLSHEQIRRIEELEKAIERMQACELTTQKKK